MTSGQHRQGGRGEDRAGGVSRQSQLPPGEPSPRLQPSAGPRASFPAPPLQVQVADSGASIPAAPVYLASAALVSYLTFGSIFGISKSGRPMSPQVQDFGEMPGRWLMSQDG